MTTIKYLVLNETKFVSIKGQWTDLEFDGFSDQEELKHRHLITSA